MTEREIQARVRLALAPRAILLRVNAGSFWSGRRVWDAVRGEYILTNLRSVTGAPEGTSDLIGCRRSDGRFVALEVKTPAGRLREEQERFLDAVRAAGGIAGMVRSAEEAIHVLEDDKNG